MWRPPGIASAVSEAKGRGDEDVKAATEAIELPNLIELQEKEFDQSWHGEGRSYQSTGT